MTWTARRQRILTCGILGVLLAAYLTWEVPTSHAAHPLVVGGEKEGFWIILPKGWWWDAATPDLFFIKKDGKGEMRVSTRVFPPEDIETLKKSCTGKYRERKAQFEGPHIVSVGSGGARGIHFHMTGDVQDPAFIDEVFICTPQGVRAVYSAGAAEEYQAEFRLFLENFNILGSPGGGFSFPEEIPDRGRVSEWLGLRWDGENERQQCGWAANQFARWYLGHGLPSVRPRGVEALWGMETPGYRKVRNNGRVLPPRGALLLWDRRAGKGNGHIAVVLWPNEENGWVRVIDCNWKNDRRGLVHDVHLATDRRIVGWLVRE